MPADSPPEISASLRTPKQSQIPRFIQLTRPLAWLHYALMTQLWVMNIAVLGSDIKVPQAKTDLRYGSGSKKRASFIQLSLIHNSQNQTATLGYKRYDITPANRFDRDGHGSAPTLRDSHVVQSHISAGDN